KKFVLVRISALFWSIWKCRNDIIFRDKKINDPMTLIKLTCNWIVDWSVLQRKPQNKGY
uniref:Reverse transcriptase zinc-binding domain-containing protein n=1 Tax=Aegilops tauschii subsp. strangulata TaxID=200361 RepID=A0A453C404_AEGTS